MDNKEFENGNNSDITEETENDNKNIENIKSGEKKNAEILKEQAQDNVAQEKDAHEEEKDTEKQAEADTQDLQGGNVENGAESYEDTNKYASSYEPPHYVPNFTVINSNGDDADAEDVKPDKKIKGNKGKKRFGIGFVAVIAAVCVIVSSTLGAIAGAIASGGINLDLSGEIGEVVTIVKNQGDITVNEVAGSTGYSGLTVAQVAKLVSESVVEITTTSVKTNAQYGQYVATGAGSGVIFSQSEDLTYAYIVTNYHVIEDADSITVTVTVNGIGSDYAATYLGGYADTDIAVLRITGTGETFTTAIIGNSDNLIVGEEVVAIGNPLGTLGGTVTNGIISALDREITVEGYTMTLLQTNAAVNPGNSGGGLFNMSGELIGIVNAKESSTGIEGLGFAIPVNTAFTYVTAILSGDDIGDPSLGITVEYKQSTSGNYYVYVTDAGDTSLAANDRIIQIEDTKISTLEDYENAVSKFAVGSTVKVYVQRGMQKGYVTVTVVSTFDS